MAYADLLQESGVQQDFLCVLKPKIRVLNWTVHSGFIYKASFNLSPNIEVRVDGVTMTAVDSIADITTASQYFYDVDAELIYLRTPQSSDPDTEITVAVYEVYIATTDENWHRIPTDTSSDVVFFEGLISTSPEIRATVSDNLLGYLPVQTSRVDIANGDHEFEKYLGDSSYNKAEISIYHALRDRPTGDGTPSLEATNIKRVLRGTMADVSWRSDRVNIKIFSRIDEFSTEYRNASTSINFFNTTDFPSVDPNYIAKPVRFVYGIVGGFIPVNIDYEADNPTTSDNRDWVVQSETSNLPNVTETVPASPTSTTTRTYVNTATGYRIGDHVRIDKATDEYRILTNVDYGSDFVEHAALSSGAATTGDSVERLWVAQVKLEQNGTNFDLFPTRDYTVTTFASGKVAGFTLNSAAEANVGAATFTPGDVLHIRVYGKTNDVTIGGSPFGSDDSETGNLTNPIVMLFDLLSNKLGLGEDAFDTTTFQSLESSITDRFGFAIAQTSTGRFPTFKELLNTFTQSLLLRFFLDQNDDWTANQIAPGITNTDTITDDEITQGTLQYTFGFQDVLSDVTVEYDFREKTGVIGSTANSASAASAESETAKWLHDINKSKTFDVYQIDASDAQTLANRLSYIFGERRGNLTVVTKDNQFFDNDIGDVTELERTAIPGFEFDAETLREKDAVLIEVKKGLRQITLKLDDQKGVEDNSGSW